MLLLYSFNSLLFLSINQLGIGAIFTASHLHVFVYGRAQLKESLVAVDVLCVAAQCCAVSRALSSVLFSSPSMGISPLPSLQVYVLSMHAVLFRGLSVLTKCKQNVH